MPTADADVTAVVSTVPRTAPERVERPRAVERVIAGTPTSDGDGVKLTRVLTQDLQRRLDPFLMLDAFGSDRPDDYIGGFPDHPHRGFETVTYMIAGRMRHRDSAGHEGLLQNGGVQWMTAGRGVVHSELPEQEQGVMEGFQLWLNLPAKEKMRAPWYRDIASEEIPELRVEGVTARVIAGASHGVQGAERRDGTEPLYLDLHFDAGARFAQALPPGHNAFVYVYRGELGVEGTGAGAATAVAAQRMAILANDPASDGVVLHAAPGAAARALLVAGRPLREPIAQYGPFVMNTEAEIRQAVADFRAGRLA
jgi:redox-sensitive bicupin YhaK (pirin superfamily)